MTSSDGAIAESAAQQEPAEVFGAVDREASKKGSFVGEVLARLCRRGHAQLVAGTLWSTLGHSASPSPAQTQNGHKHAPPSAEAWHDASNDSPADMSARRGSHAAASTSSAPAAPHLAPARTKIGRSSSTEPTRSAFTFPSSPANFRQEQKWTEQEAPLRNEERLEQHGMDIQEKFSSRRSRGIEQEEDMQRGKSSRVKTLEGCTGVREAMQSVEDAAALEKLLEALLREAGEELKEADPSQTAEILMTILEGPLLARPEVRCVPLPRHFFVFRAVIMCLCFQSFWAETCNGRTNIIMRIRCFP